MAKARAIVKRRKAVRNIRKITQTMQLIATARYAKCLQRAVASKPYTAALGGLVATLSEHAALEHPLLKAAPDARTSVLLVITSNRGLCGSYNAGVLRAGLEQYRKLQTQQLAPELEMVGKKGINYARFLKVPLSKTITDVEDRIAYARVAEMAERYMARFLAGELAQVDVAYAQYFSTAVQRPTIARLLPITAPTGTPTNETPAPGAANSSGATAASAKVQFDFSPAPQVLLEQLLPETVKLRLYQYFNDAIVSEQVSRMIAMKSATDAAGDMLKQLTQRYNRARQTQITMELLDIVGGANAIAE
jgi:F-type H+-transporting ATPase subunit gamma